MTLQWAGSWFIVTVPSHPVPHSFLSHELMGSMEHTEYLILFSFFFKSFQILPSASGKIYNIFFQLALITIALHKDKYLT